MSLDFSLIGIPEPRECGLFERNITHNLAEMAAAAGLYEPLWKPESIGATKASDLAEPLSRGLELLKSDPKRFKSLNPENGCGDYEGFVDFAECALAACRQYPDARIEVSR